MTNHYVNLEHPLEMNLLDFCTRNLTKNVKNAILTLSSKDIQVDKPEDMSVNSHTTPSIMANDFGSQASAVAHGDRCRC